MPEPIIRVENLSKSFVISHETKERYVSLRDEISSRAKRLFSNQGAAAKNASQEEFWALRDINFEIQKGDRVGIIGRNGAGKSTLLKILSRITDPTKGRIEINGRVASLLEVGTGFHPELTGRENIFLNGAILGMSRAEIRRKFDEIVAFAEVEKFLDTPVKRYSSGMYVRLAFAVAAHLEPEILIVDEVLAVGDAQFQKKCLGKMEDVSANEGRTVLFVSHNMGVVAQLCKKAIFLQHGQLTSFEGVKDTIQRYITEDSTKDQVYNYTNEGQKKSIFFTKIFLTNKDGEIAADFSFDENVILNFEFNVNDPVVNSLQVGIGLQDKLQNRVFTILQPVEKFKKDGKHFFGKVELPNSIIAPNNYTFVFALWTKDRKVFDLVEGVCAARIHDNGTDLSLYEGMDYGSIIMDAKWY